MEKWPGAIGPRIAKKLNENVLKAVDWRVDFNGDYGYEVKNGVHQFKVKLERRTCSCRAWDLTDIPCLHALCVIYDKCQPIEDYVDHCYSKEVYKSIYSYTI